jgi:hypothetical protein
MSISSSGRRSKLARARRLRFIETIRRFGPDPNDSVQLRFYLLTRLVRIRGSADGYTAPITNTRVAYDTRSTRRNSGLRRETSGRRAPIETACRRRDGRPEPQAIECDSTSGSTQWWIATDGRSRRGGSTAGASGPHTHQWALRSGRLMEGRPSSITFRSRDTERVFPTDIVHTRPPKLDVRDADETDVPASSFDKYKRVRQTVARTETAPIGSSSVVTTATPSRGASNGAPHERRVGE